MKRLLLHACCAPCAPHVIRKLKEEYLLTVFFYNPNIHGRREYDLRLKEIRRLCAVCNVPLIEGSYDPARFFDLVGPLADTGEGGERCSVCFRLRLEETCRIARITGAEVVATTLTISSHKNAFQVNSQGLQAAARYRIDFLDTDFKKKDGYLISCEAAKKHGFYRQNYCGCTFSKDERGRR
jgi:predicted adenine nucleotide alpha hydrolase (AANH) superfamily ATPase